MRSPTAQQSRVVETSQIGSPQTVSGRVSPPPRRCHGLRGRCAGPVVGGICLALATHPPKRIGVHVPHLSAEKHHHGLVFVRSPTGNGTPISRQGGMHEPRARCVDEGAFAVNSLCGLRACPRACLWHSSCGRRLQSLWRAGPCQVRAPGHPRHGHQKALSSGHV